MTPDTIEIIVDDRGVATLTLTMPERHNALAPQMIADLTEATRTLGSDPAVRAVVLTGAGKSFCAGGDLDWMRAQFTADRDTRMAEARLLAEMLGALDALPKPLIGRVNGQAFGGGLGLIAVCDVAIAVDTARFAFTETRLGLIPATIGPYVIARMGTGAARQVFMSGRPFDATDAVRLGLAARAVAAANLDAAIEDEIKPCLSAAPGAVARAKALARTLGASVTEEAVTLSIAALADAWETPEAQEGIGAFFERRKPGWVRQR